MPSATVKYSTYILFKRIFAMVRPYWIHLAVIFLLNLLSSPLTLLNPVALKLIVDNAFGNEPIPDLLAFFFPDDFVFSTQSVIVIAVFLVIVVEIIKQLQALLNWLLQTYVGEKIVITFRALIFNQVQRLSLAHHDRYGTSDALYRIQYDAPSIRSIVIGGISPFITAGFTLIGMLIVMVYIEWHFAVIAVGIIPVLLLLTQVSSARLRDTWGDVKKNESSAMAVVHETLSSLRVVKAFGQEEKEEKRFISKSNEAIKGQMKVARIGAQYDFLVGITISVATALFLYVGSNYVQAGKISLGDLIILVAYLAQIFGPLVTLSKGVTNLQSSLASVERVFTILDQRQDVTEHPEPVPISRAQGKIDFHNVFFSYNKSNPTLSDISFSIKPGAMVGVLGSTGAGKSTLINLLMRFYDVDQGGINLDGVNIKNYKISQYRAQFSLVLQEPILFSTTVRENIAYGRTGATEKEIVEAAKAANAHDFILRLEKGYETEVGERGMQLSGGERQRISIARAFLKNAPILILDEPTSSVDMGTESAIMEALERLMEGRTTFLITHRLDTLVQCDALIHLSHGQLEEFIENNTQSALDEIKDRIRNKVI